MFSLLRSETKRLKEGEDQKTKTYRALCVLPEGDLTVDEIREKVEPVKNLELDQRTPVRVLHRRPNNWRKRTVYWMEVSRFGEVFRHFEQIFCVFQVLPVQLKSSESEASAEETSSPSSSTTKPPTLFSLRLATQAGTYVKEFVHGDLQRTRPNLRKILGGREVDIVALDVEVRKWHGPSFETVYARALFTRRLSTWTGRRSWRRVESLRKKKRMGKHEFVTVHTCWCCVCFVYQLRA